MSEWCKWEGFDPMEEIYDCRHPEKKGMGITCEPCTSKEQDPLNGEECFEYDE